MKSYSVAKIRNLCQSKVLNKRKTNHQLNKNGIFEERHFYTYMSISLGLFGGSVGVDLVDNLLHAFD